MKIAIVVQRSHREIVGGSESLAWQYARLLAADHEVDIVTTASLDYVTWANDLAPGKERGDGFNVIRFKVDFERGDYWHSLHSLLRESFHQAKEKSRVFDHWPIALQEEFIRKQGPFSSGMLEYLKDAADDYDKFIFVTYLYPTTYFGAALVAPSRSMLVPTLHDEPAAYLPCFAAMAARINRCIYLTNSEKLLAENLWGVKGGTVAGMAVNSQLAAGAAASSDPYLLYSGRIDQDKGCVELVDFFCRYKKKTPGPLNLVLTGKSYIDLPRRDDVVYRGYVSEHEKFELMRRATLFVMPSAFESFSIASLEAMGQETPVLANASCEVLKEHIAKSGGGMTYGSYEEFALAVENVVANKESRDELGRNARRYLLDHYSEDAIRRRLLQLVCS